MKKVITIIIVLLLIGTIAFFAVSKYENKKKQVAFKTAKVEKGTIISMIPTTGELQPLTKVEIGTQVSGTILSMTVDYNDPVKAGQTIVRIDPSIYESKVTMAKADLQEAQANLSQAIANYNNSILNARSSQTEVTTAMLEVKNARTGYQKAKSDEMVNVANIKSASAKVKKSKADKKRYEELYAQDFVAATDKEQYVVTYETDKADFEAKKAELKSSKHTVDSAKIQLEEAYSKLNTAQAKSQADSAAAASYKAQIDSSVAKIQSAKASLDQEQINLGYCNIKSPIDGIVISKDMEVGQTVQASFEAPNIMTLAKDLKQMQIFANVDEADIAQVKKGQNVTYTVSSYPNETFKGTVKQVRSSSKKDQGVVTYQVVITAENPDLKLKPGMTATVSIETKKKENIIKIPTKAALFSPDGIDNFPYPPDYKKESPELQKAVDKGKNILELWVLKDGKPEPVDIVAGIRGTDFFEMKSGDLKEGDELIIGIKDDKKSTSN